MMETTEEQRHREFDAWVEAATAVISSNAEARVVRAQLLDHYQEHRMTLETDGWSAPEAHAAALARLGSPEEVQRTWMQRMGQVEALPWTLGWLALGLQLSGVAGWRMGMYLSWLTAATAVVVGGRRLWRTVAILAAYWQAQWSKLPTFLVLAGAIIGVAIGFEPVWAGQPIWDGHTLDVTVFWWKIPVILVSLAVLATITWRGVCRARTGAWAATGQVSGAVALGLVVGSAVGFVATWEWLLHYVVPALPGHIGYLPDWPWQAVSYTLSQHMVPAVIILTAWVMAVATMAGKVRTDRHMRDFAVAVRTRE
jgi:hypothetical protein